MFNKPEFAKEIKELRNRNPYPKDIFAETPQMDKQKINKFCRDNGISIDGYNGSWGRQVWDNCIDELERIQGEQESVHLECSNCESPWDSCQYHLSEIGKLCCRKCWHEFQKPLAVNKKEDYGLHPTDKSVGIRPAIL